MHLKNHLAAAVSALLIVSPAAAGISGVTYLAFPDSEPLAAAHAPNDPTTLYVAHRNGVIRGLDVAAGTWDVDPLLEVAGVDASGEGGLLGFAFHPDFATNQKLYVHATIDPGDAMPGVLDPFNTQVLEYTFDPGGAAPAVRTILSVPQPTAFHNGGWIGFNPAASAGEEGLLYLTIGDGDTPASAQSITSGDLLGKVLRIDPTGDEYPADADRNYAIPSTNPFIGGNEDGEIYAYGLRNPFRASIDRLTGDLWIGDVGDDTREEVDVIRAATGGGENFGWDACEGLTDSDGSGGCAVLKASTTVTDPVYDYMRPGVGPVDFTGVSVIGGVVYRGPDPAVQGRYLFGDIFAPGASYWSLDADDPVGSIANLEPELFPDDNSIGGPVAFAEDLDGNVYILTRFSGIYRIDTDAVVPGDFNADGVVDAADYTVWRDGLGSPAEYAAWQANYGATAVTWTAPSQGVPEPTTVLLAGAALLGLQLTARQR
ncbi:Soluble aldose sugar dehydrogenase YliI precursor [Planctomycetes bacterium MalM25]|nr:Soluble aldose sugar dehydrogenase YliI precursor [Planctomycetes bacterium MalM25]